jgi:hypothetical protein
MTPVATTRRSAACAQSKHQRGSVERRGNLIGQLSQIWVVGALRCAHGLERAACARGSGLGRYLEFADDFHDVVVAYPDEKPLLECSLGGECRERLTLPGGCVRCSCGLPQMLQRLTPDPYKPPKVTVGCQIRSGALHGVLPAGGVPPFGNAPALACAA